MHTPSNTKLESKLLSIVSELSSFNLLEKFLTYYSVLLVQTKFYWVFSCSKVALMKMLHPKYIQFLFFFFGEDQMRLLFNSNMWLQVHTVDTSGKETTSDFLPFINSHFVVVLKPKVIYLYVKTFRIPFTSPSSFCSLLRKKFWSQRNRLWWPHSSGKEGVPMRSNGRNRLKLLLMPPPDSCQVKH